MWYRCEALGQSNQAHQLQLTLMKNWILWRHVKIKKMQIVYNLSYTLTKMSYFSVFWVELCKTLENDWHEIKILTGMKNFHFWVKYGVLSKQKMNFWKILIFATHGNTFTTFFYHKFIFHKKLTSGKWVSFPFCGLVHVFMYTSGNWLF